jgi:hypothetical protein
MFVILIVLKNIRDKKFSLQQEVDLSWLIFVLVLAFELEAGYYFNHVNGMVMGDAVARVANAFYVINIHPPHLASIGFIWNPLPSFLEIPFIALTPLIKPMATSAFAGVIVTSLFAAGTAVLIYKNCRHFNVPAWANYLLVALYTFNPFIFIYGFNGMSEAIFIFFIVWTITELVQWIEDEKLTHLVWIGIALALAFLTRYEAIPFAAAIFLTVCFFMIKKRRQSGEVKSIWSYFEGTVIVIFVPLVTCIALWVLANWIIMGDPLYFLTSEYSNAVQSEANLPPDIKAIVGDKSAVFLYVLKKSLVFLPLFIFILFIRLLNKQLFKWETLMLIALTASIPAFQYIMLYTGSSFGWLRFFVYPLPIAMAWLPYEFNKIAAQKIRLKTILVTACATILIASGVVTGVLFNYPDMASEEYTTYKTGNSGFQVQKQIAAYVNKNCSDGILLLDSFQTYYVILHLDSTKNLITTSSYDFQQAVADPWEYEVKYILTVNSAGLGISDAINNYYPGLYENGADWCTLEKDFGDYRLYKVNIILEIERDIVDNPLPLFR